MARAQDRIQNEPYIYLKLETQTDGMPASAAALHAIGTMSVAWAQTQTQE